MATQQSPQQGFRSVSAEAQWRGSCNGGVRYKSWQCLAAAAAFTVAAKSEINADGVLKTSKGICIVAVERFT